MFSKKKDKIFRAASTDDRACLMNLELVGAVELSKNHIKFLYSNNLALGLTCDDEKTAKEVFEDIERRMRD